MEDALDLDLYEMDLRQYDLTIARWISIDPVTHFSFSTYSAFDNNPIFWSDPSGADSVYNFETGEYVINGKVVTYDDALDYANSGGNADGSNNNTPNESESNEDCCGGYIGSYKHNMTPKEKAYYRNNKDKKKIVSKAAYEAGMLATKVTGNLDLGGDNFGYSGAIRHSYWMYLVTVELGPELAKKLGILHEDFELKSGMNNMKTRDSKMDQINNAFGISIAELKPDLTAVEFEEIFLKTVNHKNKKYQKLIKIYNTSTIPKLSLKAKSERAERMEQRTFARFGEW